MHASNMLQNDGMTIKHNAQDLNLSNGESVKISKICYEFLPISQKMGFLCVIPKGHYSEELLFQKGSLFQIEHRVILHSSESLF